MSATLSALILVELQKISGEPAFAAQQKQLADAIAKAVQEYLIAQVTVVGVSPAGTVTGKLIAK